MRATSALLVLTLIMAGCGASSEGGFGAPAQVPGEFALGPGRPVVGILQLADNGCWYAELNGTPRLAIFPVGFDLNSDNGGELIDHAGAIYRDGDRFDGTASIARKGDIADGADGKWGSYMAFCRPDLEELVVFDTLVHEFDPTALTSEGLAELLESAVWAEHFPCGRGWATSTADQQVGLVIYEAQSDSSVAGGRVVFPDPDWNATVLIGKNLFAEHCNDAIEDWLALPTIAAEWPLTSGTLTIIDEVPGRDDDPGLVRASLSAAQVDTGTGSIPLPRIELENRSYNFFAG